MKVLTHTARKSMQCLAACLASGMMHTGMDFVSLLFCCNMLPEMAGMAEMSTACVSADQQLKAACIVMQRNGTNCLVSICVSQYIQS